MIKKYFQIKFFFFGFLGSFFFPFLAKADSALGGLDKTAEKTGHKGEEGINVGGITDILSGIIQTVLSLLGVLFLLLMIYGGYLYMTARGNEEQLEKAKKIITQTFIGIIIVLAAYAISWFMIDKFGTLTMY